MVLVWHFVEFVLMLYLFVSFRGLFLYKYDININNRYSKYVIGGIINLFSLPGPSLYHFRLPHENCCKILYCCYKIPTRLFTNILYRVIVVTINTLIVLFNFGLLKIYLHSTFEKIK